MCLSMVMPDALIKAIVQESTKLIEEVKSPVTTKVNVSGNFSFLPVTPVSEVDRTDMLG